MINSFSIKHFKQFKSLEVEGITPITIIGGKNNTGKTTILEALIFFYDRGSPQVTMKQLSLRGFNPITLSPLGLWAPIFHAYDISKNIDIELKNDSKIEKLITKHNSNYKQYIKTDAIKENTVEIKLNTDFFITEALDLEYFVDNKPNGQLRLVIEGSQVVGAHQKNFSNSKKRVAYVFGSGIHPNEQVRWFGEIDIEGKVDELIDSVQIIEPRLKSLSLIPHGDRTLIYGDIGIGRKIPLSFLGKGTVKLVSIIMAILTAKDGIVLIDEIENGIHYSLHAKLWELLYEMSNKYNCQFFITTHSYEILEHLQESKIKNPDQISYLRLDLEEDEIVPKIYSMEILLAALERYWEVR